MKKLIAIILLVSVAVCVPILMMNKHKAEKTADIMEILDSGFSYNENGDITYAVVFKNNGDKIISKARFEAEAFDENGEPIEALSEDAIYMQTEEVGPGETAACVYMFKSALKEEYGMTEPFKNMPADMSFKAASYTEFSKESVRNPDLEIVDYELIEDDFYREDDAVCFKVRVANRGEEDFIYDYHNGETNNYMAGNVVYRDGSGKVIGGATLGVSSLNHQDEGDLVFKAGEETEIECASSSGYWPSESQELYLTALYY